MPLYQMIMITKCTQSVLSANLLRNVTKFICEQGGNVRDLKILADRLLAKEMKSIDKQGNLLGRYNQVLFDGPPSIMPLIQNQFKFQKNMLKISFFKVKDFYSYAQQYNKPIASQIAQGSPKFETAKNIAVLREERADKL